MTRTFKEKIILSYNYTTYFWLCVIHEYCHFPVIIKIPNIFTIVTYFQIEKTLARYKNIFIIDMYHILRKKHFQRRKDNSLGKGAYAYKFRHHNHTKLLT